MAKLTKEEILAVQEAVKRITGKEPFKGINPDECVAIGAAIQAGKLEIIVPGVLDNRKNAHALFSRHSSR